MGAELTILQQCIRREYEYHLLPQASWLWPFYPLSPLIPATTGLLQRLDRNCNWDFL
jgi:hypothetical protein